MKKLLLGLLLLYSSWSILSGQSLSDPLIIKCLKSTDSGSKYLKDFRIELGKGTPEAAFRYKAHISLWNNTRYRFTLCTAENSKGQLIMSILDDVNNPVLSSVDHKTGTVYTFVDLVCNKSGIYQICFDFTQEQTGSGVCIVSLIQESIITINM